MAFAEIEMSQPWTCRSTLYRWLWNRSLRRGFRIADRAEDDRDEAIDCSDEVLDPAEGAGEAGHLAEALGRRLIRRGTLTSPFVMDFEELGCSRATSLDGHVLQYCTGSE